MKLKNIFVLIPLLGIGVAALWWFTRPAAEAPSTAKIAGAPSALKSALVQSTPKPSQVEAPKAAPVPASEPPALSPAELHAELNATIDDVESLCTTNDVIGLYKKYTPPNELAEDENRNPGGTAAHEQSIIRQLDSMPERMQGLLEILQSLKDQTPEINATGDQATYHITLNPKMFTPKNPEGPMPVIPMTFEKVGGRWYIKSGSGFTG